MKPHYPLFQKFQSRILFFGLLAAGILSFLLWTGCDQLRTGASNVSFNEDIRPVFNENCIACHGGVKSEAGFSLLFEQDALGSTNSGKPAIVPGDVNSSEIVRRITHPDPEERMPPDSDSLPREKIRKIKSWVKNGAQWEKHWAYIKPEPVPLPAVRNEEWPRNGIDYFILDRLESAGLSPSPEANPAVLLRRVALDLTGLPPSPGQAEFYLKNPTDENYERVVDKLLSSPHFGERWTAMWLDLARYADSKGYEKDPHREIWKYRDWLIRAFNRDMPFDRFTIEQLAGDLLPESTRQQLIATAFHRNTMTNTEGGTLDEEYRVAAIIDRVNTTMEVWQGTTMQCVQCHSHPYDPFRQEEFYQIYAFFNQTADADRRDDRPFMRVFDGENARQGYQLLKQAKVIESSIDSLAQTEEIIRKCESWIAEKQDILSRALENDEPPIVKPKGFPTDDLVKVLKILRLPRDEWYRDDARWVYWFYSMIGPDFAELRRELSGVEEQIADLDPAVVPVMQELPATHRRPTYVFDRGNWKVRNEKVEPDVPQSLNPFPQGAPENRLGFAEWLVSPENPLIARVLVNRFWAELFGRGIVETVSDFGALGAEPTHPRMLDWLALQFMHEHNWSMKELLKKMVMSSAYRQSSKVLPEILEQDPQNKLLARGPRIRLTAEQVRDQALAVSGLLHRELYGPSVMPPQPPDIWKNPYNGQKWETSMDSSRYRRAIYIYWKRTAPYPSMVTFDAPSREVMVSRRISTNTPLQALVTINDVVYIEAARALAEWMQETTGGDVDAQITAGYRKVFIRTPQYETVRDLRDLYDYALDYYQSNSGDAAVFTAMGLADESGPETAALTLVASAMMNLDSFIMKE